MRVPGVFWLTANTHTWKKVLCQPMDNRSQYPRGIGSRKIRTDSGQACYTEGCRGGSHQHFSSFIQKGLEAVTQLYTTREPACSWLSTNCILFDYSNSCAIPPAQGTVPCVLFCNPIDDRADTRVFVTCCFWFYVPTLLSASRQGCYPHESNRSASLPSVSV